jgi:hypothetical protein
MRGMRAVAFAGAVLMSGLSCDLVTGPKGPTAGSLQVRLTTPNADDGAIIFVVSGGTIDSVTRAAGSSYQVLAAVGSQTKVLVRGTIGAGAIAQIWVPDVSVAYAAQVQQAASRTYVQRTDAGYSMEVW